MVEPYRKPTGPQPSHPQGAYPSNAATGTDGKGRIYQKWQNSKLSRLFCCTRKTPTSSTTNRKDRTWCKLLSMLCKKPKESLFTSEHARNLNNTASYDEINTLESPFTSKHARNLNNTASYNEINTLCEQIGSEGMEELKALPENEKAQLSKKLQGILNPRTASTVTEKIMQTLTRLLPVGTENNIELYENHFRLMEKLPKGSKILGEVFVESLNTHFQGKGVTDINFHPAFARKVIIKVTDENLKPLQKELENLDKAAQESLYGQLGNSIFSSEQANQIIEFLDMIRPSTSRATKLYIKYLSMVTDGAKKLRLFRSLIDKLQVDSNFNPQDKASILTYAFKKFNCEDPNNSDFLKVVRGGIKDLVGHLVNQYSAIEDESGKDTFIEPMSTEAKTMIIDQLIDHTDFKSENQWKFLEACIKDRPLKDLDKYVKSLSDHFRTSSEVKSLLERTRLTSDARKLYDNPDNPNKEQACDVCDLYLKQSEWDTNETSKVKSFLGIDQSQQISYEDLKKQLKKNLESHVNKHIEIMPDLLENLPNLIESCPTLSEKPHQYFPEVASLLCSLSQEPSLYAKLAKKSEKLQTDYLSDPKRTAQDLRSILSIIKMDIPLQKKAELTRVDLLKGKQSTEWTEDDIDFVNDRLKANDKVSFKPTPNLRMNKQIKKIVAMKLSEKLENIHDFQAPLEKLRDECLNYSSFISTNHQSGSINNTFNTFYRAADKNLSSLTPKDKMLLKLWQTYPEDSDSQADTTSADNAHAGDQKLLELRDLDPDFIASIYDYFSNQTERSVEDRQGLLACGQSVKHIMYRILDIPNVNKTTFTLLDMIYKNFMPDLNMDFTETELSKLKSDIKNVQPPYIESISYTAKSLEANPVPNLKNFCKVLESQPSSKLRFFTKGDKPEPNIANGSTFELNEDLETTTGLDYSGLTKNFVTQLFISLKTKHKEDKLKPEDYQDIGKFIGLVLTKTKNDIPTSDFLEPYEWQALHEQLYLDKLESDPIALEERAKVYSVAKILIEKSTGYDDPGKRKNDLEMCDLYLKQDNWNESDLTRLQQLHNYNKETLQELAEQAYNETPDSANKEENVKAINLYSKETWDKTEINTVKKFLGIAQSQQNSDDVLKKELEKKLYKTILTYTIEGKIKHIEQLAKGMKSVDGMLEKLPDKYEELESAVQGKFDPKNIVINSRIDVSYNPIVFLWGQSLKAKMQDSKTDKEEIKDVLQFITGSRTTGKILIVDIDGQHFKAHTCFNRLDIPRDPPSKYKGKDNFWGYLVVTARQTK